MRTFTWQSVGVARLSHPYLVPHGITRGKSDFTSPAASPPLDTKRGADYICMMVQMNKDDAQGNEEACCSGLAELLSPQLFKALSDTKRLELLIRVAEGEGPSAVGSVAEGSGVDMSVVSRHLAILRDAGVIRCERQRKEDLCTLQTDAVVQLADAPVVPHACQSIGNR